MAGPLASSDAGSWQLAGRDLVDLAGVSGQHRRRTGRPADTMRRTEAAWRGRPTIMLEDDLKCGTGRSAPGAIR
jgi:hypothetical protein